MEVRVKVVVQLNVVAIDPRIIQWGRPYLAGPTNFLNEGAASPRQIFLLVGLRTASTYPRPQHTLLSKLGARPLSLGTPICRWTKQLGKWVQTVRTNLTEQVEPITHPPQLLVLHYFFGEETIVFVPCLGLVVPGRISIPLLGRFVGWSY